MISKVEGIHNGKVFVILDIGYKTITVSDVATGTYRAFHEFTDIFDVYRTFEQNFSESIGFKEACLFFKIDLIV